MSIMEGGIPVAVPETIYQENGRAGHKTAAFTVAMEYTNYTKTELYVRTQNNIVISVAPNVTSLNGACQSPHLEVRVIYTLVDNNTIAETMKLLRSFNQNGIKLSKDANFMYERLGDIYSRDPSMRNKSNVSLTIVQRVAEDEIRSKKVLYFKECDIVITQDKSKIIYPHPSSNEGLQSIEFGTGEAYSGQAGVFVKVIDNEHIAKARYYYAGRRLISVPSIQDDTYHSGVYCTYATMQSDGCVTPNSFFMTFEEAEEEIGLFRTKEEAYSNGDPDQLVRLEEAKAKVEEARSRSEERRLSLELQAIKHESNVATARAERELTEVRRALELAKAETISLKEATEFRKMLRDDQFDGVKKRRDDTYSKKDKKRSEKALKRKEEIESRGLYRKDRYEDIGLSRRQYYEDRSLDRKDSSEMIKFIPALLVGIAGTFAWMKATQN